MHETSVVGDGLSSPGAKVIDLLGNLTALFETANKNLEGVPICPSAGFIWAILSNLCAGQRK